LNVYDLYRRCYNAGEPLNRTYPNDIGHALVGGELKPYRKYYTAKEYTPWLFPDFMGDYLGQEDDNPMGPCSFGIPMSEFINDPEIRTLLHIPDTVQAWDMCSNHINYTSGKIASQWIYPTLKEKGTRILFYSGDTDGAVPTHGS